MIIFYSMMRFAYRHGLGRQHMLHYPLYRRDGQDLMEGQARFTDAVLAPFAPVGGTDLVDVGCGNGVQTLYVHDTYGPRSTRGIDLNATHIADATRAASGRTGIGFSVDDAQTLSSIEDSSADRVLCTESAHHYPDKGAFLKSVRRVLRPGGKFSIAELVLRDGVKLRPIDGLLSMHHWDLPRYRAALADAGLKIEVEDDLTEGLVRGFENSAAWFDRSAGSGNWLARATARVIGKMLIALYRWELANRYRYLIIAGTRP